jgi:hypothetical protein
MAPIDWRKLETYERIRDLDAVGLAWEYLRRNPDYRRAYVESNGVMSAFGHEIPLPLRHWGLSFPSRSRAFSPRSGCLLVADCCANCRSSCSGIC